jgi:serine/threonine protein kinase
MGSISYKSRQRYRANIVSYFFGKQRKWGWTVLFASLGLFALGGTGIFMWFKLYKEHMIGLVLLHRDLKPANILVTKQGIKLLDFAGEASCSPEGDYVSSDFKLMAVSLKLGTEAVEPSAPRELFKLPAVDTGFSPYAAAPDGQRFLVRATPQQQAAEPLTVIVNWPALLKKAATAQ